MGLPSSVLGGSLLTLTLLVMSRPFPSEAYIERILENDSVCSVKLSSSTIFLQGFEDKSALVVKDSRYFKHWTGRQEFNCRFTVSSSPSSGLGLFAVIQRMSFRRDEDGKCIDYVKFRHDEKSLSIGDYNIKFKPTEPWSPEICGKVNSLEVNVDDDKYNDISEEDNNKAITNSFIDHKGLIEVKIHIADISLKPGEELFFEIVFTSFQEECKFDHGLWKSCGGKTCIYKEFFKDGKLNCPYKSCKDENGCQAVISVLNGNGYHFNTTFGTKIMAGTVAGLLTMFVAFIAFLWIFRHCGTFLCCMGYSNSHPHSSEMQRVPNLDTMVVMATAPPDSLVASGTDVRTSDKDLPPSYESLFPSK